MFLQEFLSSIPFLAVWGLGVVLSMMFLRQNRKKFTLTLISFLIFIVNNIGDIYIRSMLLEEISSRSITAVQMTSYSSSFRYCVSMPLWIIGWILLLIAIFNPKLDSIETIESNLYVKTDSNQSGNSP
jgi:hypothetical protein